MVIVSPGIATSGILDHLSEGAAPTRDVPDGTYLLVDEHSGSLSLPFETVLEEAFDTETWLFRYDGEKPITREQLLAEKEGYDQFRAFQTGEVYGCNTRTSRFYEESPFRPDRLLSDFIQILHPDLKSSQPLRYFRKVE